MLINFPISRYLIPVANFNAKLRASVSTELRVMLEILTRSAQLKSFQKLLLHEDINLDLSLEMWLLFILNISDHIVRPCYGTFLVSNICASEVTNVSFKVKLYIIRENILGRTKNAGYTGKYNFGIQLVRKVLLFLKEWAVIRRFLYLWIILRSSIWNIGGEKRVWILLVNRTEWK